MPMTHNVSGMQLFYVNHAKVSCKPTGRINTYRLTGITFFLGERQSGDIFFLHFSSLQAA